MRGSALGVLVAAALIPSGLLGQGYQPTYPDTRGTQLVAVYLGAASCGPCRLAATHLALDSIKVQLARQALAAGQQFRAVIVSMDWEPDSGLVFARESGNWDEIIVGRNWTNLGAEFYIWGDTATAPSMPQVIVYTQSIRLSSRVEFGPRTVLKRVANADALARWAAQGSPLRDASARPN